MVLGLPTTRWKSVPRWVAESKCLGRSVRTLEGKGLGVLGESGKAPKQFGWIHEIACPSENELYVAELLNWRVQKLSLHPGTSERAARQQ